MSASDSVKTAGDLRDSSTASVKRIPCPHCSAECIEQETNCWQCGKLLRPAPADAASAASAAPASDAKPAAKPASPQAGSLLNRVLGKPAPAAQPEGPPKPLINFEPGASASEQPTTRMAMTLTGEMVEVEDTPPSQEPPAATVGPQATPAATIGDSAIEAGPTQQLIRLTWCKHCGYDNPEGIVECVKCKNILEVVDIKDAPGEIEQLPRAWSFDVLGAVWIVLGIAAIYCGQFLIKTDNSRHGTGWSDYFWTGIVASAPGILIFMRHYFCKLLFWVMTLASVLVWAVLGVIWVTGHLYVSDNGQIGLEWLGAFTALSVVSYITVRQNDAFDYAN